VLALANSQLPTANAQSQQPPQPRHGRLFPPRTSDCSSSPDRTLWQKPDQIMDAVHVADGSTVADIGAGAGGSPSGLAQRSDRRARSTRRTCSVSCSTRIKRRVQREGLENVATVQAHGNDPMLPTKTLDAILMVDAYQEVDNRVVYLRNLANALKPTGRIGIVNWKPGRGGPGPGPQ
jgi:cyclopropane fatty-acyl-phospholipid synthase-like methyltransferase